MADLAATSIPTTSPRAGRQAGPMADGVTLYAGALVGFQAGYVNHWAAGVNDAFLGIMLGGVDRAGDGILIGETSDTPDPEAYLDTSGVTLLALTVLGSPTQAKVGQHIYCSTSNTADMTLDPAGAGTARPIGYMSRYTSATDQDVTLFTPTESKAAGGNVYCLSFAVSLDTITAADVITDFAIPHRFKIVDFQYVTDVAGSASDNATITLEIIAAAVTGGSLVIDDNTGTRGIVLAATAITAANVGAAGDTLTLVAGTVTDFASGSGTFNIYIQDLGL